MQTTLHFFDKGNEHQVTPSAIYNSASDNDQKMMHGMLWKLADKVNRLALYKKMKT